MKPLSLTALSILVAVAAYSAEIIKPQINEPLRHAAVTRAPDGTWYLTGTRSTQDYQGKPDFLSNDGPKLWSSQDLKTWKDEGLMYDLMEDKTWHDYLSFHYSQPDRPLSEWSVRGITQPKLSFIDGKVYMAYSSCDNDVRWMVANNAKGPYKRLLVKKKGYGKFQNPYAHSRGPGDGELFVDPQSKKTYQVWGPGYILEAGKDMDSQVKGSKRFLLAEVAGYPNADWCLSQFDPHGASLYIHNGQYILTWGAYTDEAGYKRDDTFYAVADQLDGPYSEPKRLIVGGGAAVLFDGGQNGLMASCSIADETVLVPVTVEGTSFTALQPTLPQQPKAARAGAIVMYDYANSKPSGKRFEKSPTTDRSSLVPVIDMPLADPSICTGADGAYYMTGTAASKVNGQSDFQNNDGIYLWRSTDLDTWLPLGKVWDIEKDGNDWHKAYRINASNPVRNDFCRGVTAPEISCVDGTYYLTYSMNGRGTGLLKSTTDKAAGPYQDMGRITAMGEAPSLFHDDISNDTYWLWGKGCQIAKVDLVNAQLASKAKDLFLQLHQTKDLTITSCTMDLRHVTGPYLFTAKEQGKRSKGKMKYYLSFSGITQRNERANREVAMATGETLDSPFLGPVPMIAHGCQTTVFRTAKGEMFATFAGADPTAVSRNQPCIVPMEWVEIYKINYPRMVWGDYHTPRGPWRDIVPVKGLEKFGNLRDAHCFKAPDGYYYFSASGRKAEPWIGGIPYWRAKDLRGPWEYLGHLFTWEDMRDDPNWPGIEPDDNKSLTRGIQFAYEPSMNYHHDTYWLTCWFGGAGWGKDKVWKKYIGALLKSTSGKATGPYVLHSEQAFGLQSVIEGFDGSMWGGQHGGAFWKFDDELVGIDKEWQKSMGDRVSKTGKFIPASIDGRVVSEDCGYQMMKIDGYYIFMGLSGHCSYENRVFCSKNITGPYTYMGMIPGIGNINIAQNIDGKWMTTFPQNKKRWVQFTNYFKDTDEYDTASPHTWEVTIDLKSEKPSIWPAHDVDHVHKAIYQELY